MADWSPVKVENLVERDAWVSIDDVVPDVPWFWRGLVRYCEVECCGLDAFDLTEDSVRWACGEDVPDAGDRGWRSDEPGDPGVLAGQLRAAAQQVRDLGVPAVSAPLFNRVLTAESYGSLFDSLAAKLERVGSVRAATTGPADGRPALPPEKVFSVHGLDRLKLPATGDECRRAISAAATTLTQPTVGSVTALMFTAEGRAFARHVASSETSRGIADGLVHAQDLVVSFAGNRSGQVLAVTLAGIAEGRELAAIVTEMPAAQELAASLGYSSEGLDSAVSLARSPVGGGLVTSLCRSDASLTYASDVAQTEVGQLVAQYLADSSRALPGISSAVTRTEKTRAMSRQVAGTRTCHDLAAALVKTTAGRNLTAAMNASDPVHEIIRTVEPISRNSIDGDTNTAALASSCIMLQIVMQFSVITAGLVLYVAFDASTA